MAFQKYTGTFKSSNGVNRIQYYIYEPESEIRGIIQISHGMCEYMTMYEGLVNYLCNYGFLVCGNDHLGHGESVASAQEYGYFSKKDGWRHLIKDVKKLNHYVRREYPDVPCFLLGHSMGSFIARMYVSLYRDTVDGAIFMGTSGKVHGIVEAIGILKGYQWIKGDKYRSNQINAWAFGTYNRRYRDEDDHYSWLCHDEEFRKNYVTDERNGFIFTLGGFLDLAYLVYYISRKSWYRRVPKNLPYLLMGGTEDPVGQYGRGVKEVYKKMVKSGCSNVTMQLYEGDRHVLIYEDDKEEVMENILMWLRKQGV
ncbi:MAG: alpha/beta fold hydrolase [Lachnospiraceae bacterium]|nr:alpha/beta fold hydrolase [Lachnospiraceae bacterium]